MFLKLILFCFSLEYACECACQNATTDTMVTTRDSCVNGVKISFTHVKTLYTLSHEKDSIGIAYIFFPNGSVRELSYFTKGVITRQVGWYPSGMKSYEYRYCNGKACGQVKRYFESGALKCIQFFKDGFLDGRVVWYKENGKIERVEYYNMGNEIKK